MNRRDLWTCEKNLGFSCCFYDMKNLLLFFAKILIKILQSLQLIDAQFLLGLCFSHLPLEITCRLRTIRGTEI